MDISSRDLHLALSIIKNSPMGFIYPLRRLGDNMLALVDKLNITNLPHNSHLPYIDYLV